MIGFSEAQLSAWYGAVFWPLVRVLALFMTAPVLGHRAVPVRVKVGLALAVTIVLIPATTAPPIGDLLSGAGLTLLAQNILLGALMGFTVRLVFAAMEMAGEFIGLQMGLSFAGFFNPGTGTAENAVSSFMSLLTLLIFLAIDGHLMLLHALAESFRLYPLGEPLALPMSFDRIAMMGSGLFAIALHIALPFIAVMLLVNVVLGVLARVAPQINIFAVGFPLTIGVGFSVLLLGLPYIEAPIRAALEQAVGMWVR